ncbi:unnamed protein product [Pieris brassicae]|uniref:Uncharacterized protein n=1 Tax=Pieris brassicae TaxID=7116 RepID=A0A9P0TV09_PIEBR|nr:unnamed protein product [Pieris brassicae]
MKVRAFLFLLRVWTLRLLHQKKIRIKTNEAKVKSTQRQVRALKAKLQKTKKLQLKYKDRVERAKKVISNTGLLEM